MCLTVDRCSSSRPPLSIGSAQEMTSPRQLGDCHLLHCMNEWYPFTNNITLSKYAFELPEIFAYDKVAALFPGWTMGMFGHSPDTVRPVFGKVNGADSIRGTSGIFGPYLGPRRPQTPRCLALTELVRLNLGLSNRAHSGSLPHPYDHHQPSRHQHVTHHPA